jgi:hypothetical protein
MKSGIGALLNSCPVSARFLKSTQWCKLISPYTVHILVSVWMYICIGDFRLMPLGMCPENRYIGSHK